MSNLIEGNAGVAGATVSWTGAATGNTTSDSTGNYTIPNLASGAYTITPTLAGFTFTPVNSAQTVAAANILGVNFTAKDSNVSSNVIDDRTDTNRPNTTVDVQGTEMYVAPTSPSEAPPVDSRTTGAPVDSRTSGNIPENSRK
jgi:hypothetical protein